MNISLCYAILNFEKIYSSIKNIEKRQGILYAIYFAVSLIFLLNPLNTDINSITSFDRIIGDGVISNIDVSKKVSNFTLWFMYFGIASILFYLLINYIKNKKKYEGDSKKVFDFLDNLIIFANINNLFRCITFFYDSLKYESVFYYSTSIITMIIIMGMAYILLNLEEKISSNSYFKLGIISFCMSFAIAIISGQEWENGRLLFGIQYILFFIDIFISMKIGKKLEKTFVKNILLGNVLVFSMIPFLTSFYIEFINILNQHEIFVTHLRKYYFALIMFTIIISIIVGLIIHIRKYKIVNWKKWVYPWLIFGIACLYAQVPLEIVADADIFETANSSVLISDFLNFNSIPIVEHYGGHMMTDVWEGFIYAILNNDFSGAIVSPYSGYIITIISLIFYAIIKKVSDEDIALLLTIFFPFYKYVFYYGIGILIFFAILAYIRKNTYPRAILVALSLVWAALYRLDLGYSFGIAGVIGLIYYIFLNKNWKAFKQLLITGIIIGILGVGIWCGLCLYKDINPITRLLEFLAISFSNLNWAYSEIGDNSKMLFAWCYIIVPCISIGCLCYTIFSKEFKKQIGIEKWMLLFILGLAYLANFSRGIVRHSLYENSTKVTLWDTYLFIPMFFTMQKDNKKLFLPIFTLLILCTNVLSTSSNFVDNNIGDFASSNIGKFTSTWTIDKLAKIENENDGNLVTYWQEIYDNKTKVQRVKLDDEIDGKIKSYKQVIDILLDEDETFVDFMNKSFVYSAINRKNPVYISQSPLQLSGEFSQKEFIKQIKDIPIVLMPVNNYRVAQNLDGIPNAFRYYKVAEYIYQNYVPLCQYENEFAVWCKKNKYQEFNEKIKPLIIENDYLYNLKNDLNFVNNCEIEKDVKNNQVIIKSIENDSYIDNLQNSIDLSPYIGQNIKLSIEYSIDKKGIIALYHTTDIDEQYSIENAKFTEVSGNDEIEFIIPIEQYSKLRIDIPEKSTLTIKSFKISSLISNIDYGYDYSESFQDFEAFHVYNIKYLPNIWAENDKAIKNNVILELKKQKNCYIYNNDDIKDKTKGNYLLISANCFENMKKKDVENSIKTDDDIEDVIVKLGEYKNNEFTEKYEYKMKLEKGKHNYLIRVSSDYNWYMDNINSVQLESDSILHDVKMKILEGD